MTKLNSKIDAMTNFVDGTFTVDYNNYDTEIKSLTAQDTDLADRLAK